MLSEIILIPGMMLRVAGSELRVLSVQGKRVEFALIWPEHVTVRILDEAFEANASRTP